MANLSDTTPEVAPSSPLAQPVRQFEALLEVSETIAQQRDLKLLFHELSNRLSAVLQFDFLGLILHDPARGTMRLHILESHEPIQRRTLPPVHEKIAGRGCAFHGNLAADHRAPSPGHHGFWPLCPAGYQ